MEVRAPLWVMKHQVRVLRMLSEIKLSVDKIAKGFILHHCNNGSLFCLIDVLIIEQKSFTERCVRSGRL